MTDLSAASVARAIVEAVLTHLDEHIRRYGLASVDEETKQQLITVVARMIQEDRSYF